MKDDIMVINDFPFGEYHMAGHEDHSHVNKALIIDCYWLISWRVCGFRRVSYQGFRGVSRNDDGGTITRGVPSRLAVGMGRGMAHPVMETFIF